MAQAQARQNGDTRERILDAAEALFVEHGFDGTSMRLITARADCNIAAVNYYFGSKEALIQEVFRRRLAWLNRERLRALDVFEREAGGSPLKPHQILEAFFGTALRIAADTENGGNTFMRLLSRTYSDPSEFVRGFLADEYAEVLPRFKEALFRSLPDVPQAEILWRLHFMLGAMSYALVGTDALKLVADLEFDDREPTAALGPRLMSFLLGGLRAPLPQLREGTRPGAAREPPPRTGARRRSAGAKLASITAGAAEGHRRAAKRRSTQ